SWSPAARSDLCRAPPAWPPARARGRALRTPGPAPKTARWRRRSRRWPWAPPRARRAAAGRRARDGTPTRTPARSASARRCWSLKRPPAAVPRRAPLEKRTAIHRLRRRSPRRRRRRRRTTKDLAATSRRALRTELFARAEQPQAEADDGEREAAR